MMNFPDYNERMVHNVHVSINEMEWRIKFSILGLSLNVYHHAINHCKLPRNTDHKLL